MKKNSQPRILYPTKMYFRNESVMKPFSDERKLSIASEPNVQGPTDRISSGRKEMISKWHLGEKIRLGTLGMKE